MNDQAQVAPLIRLYDDNLISILGYLTPPDIISLRKTCKRLAEISHTRIIWTQACMRCMSSGYPIPSTPLESMSISELEISSFDAYRLGRKWLSSLEPRFVREFTDISSAPIFDVRFVPGRGHRWILTVSKSVWSVLALWDVDYMCSLKGPSFECSKPISKWSPKGGVFKSFRLNTDPTSVAALAIGLLHDGIEMLYILNIAETDGRVTFETVTSFPTGFSPVELDGDLIALSDQQSKVVTWNWRTNEYATLSIGQNDDESEGFWRQNDCNQVLFSRSSNATLVVREQSIHLFPFPDLRSIEQGPLTYTEIAHHHFGSIAGISVTITEPEQDSARHRFLILLRRKGSNPWLSDTHTIEHYTLLPDPTYDPDSPSTPKSSSYDSPYIFPPALQSQISNLRGSLSNIIRSTNIVLGRNCTAVWINPRDRAAAGMLGDVEEYAIHLTWRVSLQSNEQLMAAVFRGPLLNQRPTDEGGVLFQGAIISNESNNWTAMDYDEDRGRIVVGSSSGNLSVIFL